MAAKPIVYALDPSQWVEWVYERTQGDLSCFAPTKAEAIRAFAEHGFINVPPAKVKKQNRLLSDVLKKEAIV